MRGELLAFQRKQIETERVAALGMAATSISHDLRHHLAALVANAEFLYEAEKLKLDRDQVYREIQDAAGQITELLDSLRDLARERSNISPMPASLDQSMRRAIDAVLARPEMRGRSISVHASGDMTGTFDPKKMERAFFNLALNACEATEAHQGTIAVNILSSEKFFEIRVADNGRGIPATIRTTLFDPFVSAGKSNGTGLGLAIVSKIVRDHGGLVSVESTSTAGTVFLIMLPRSQHPVEETKWQEVNTVIARQPRRRKFQPPHFPLRQSGTIGDTTPVHLLPTVRFTLAEVLTPPPSALLFVAVLLSGDRGQRAE